MRPEQRRSEGDEWKTRRARNAPKQGIVERCVRRDAIRDWAHEQPGEESDEARSDVHAPRFLPLARAPAHAREGEGWRSLLRGMQSLVLGASGEFPDYCRM